MTWYLTLTRWHRSCDGLLRPEQHAEEVEGPDLEFVMAHAATHRWFAERPERVRVEVDVLW